MKIAIRNGHLIDPKHGRDEKTDLFISDGRVAAVGQAPAGFIADEDIDAAGHVICPGLVDLSARLREPGFEYMATLESEMQAAIAGGITHLACPPDTDPVLDEPGLVEMLKHRAINLNQARVYPVGALTMGLKGQMLTEMAELTDAGCVAFSQAEAPLTDNLVLFRAMQYAATFGYTVWLRPQDACLSRDGVAHEGEVATRLGLPGIPAIAETIAIKTILELMEATGAQVHLCRLSTAAGVELVRQAKADGLPVTCDVAAHHLHLSENDVGYFDSHCHLSPPLRGIRDRDGLRAGLAEGVIDAVCSDHTPVDEDAKLLPFGESEAGATGLELLLPLTLKWAREMRLPLAQAIARVTVDAARVLGINAGHLGIGQAADLVIFDPEAEWRVTAASLQSQGKNTPYLGLMLQGRVCRTLVDGKITWTLKTA